MSLSSQEGPFFFHLVSDFEKTSKLQNRCMLEASWNVMAHAQKPHFVFRRNRRVHLNPPGKGGRGRQFSRLLAAEVCATAVVMLDTPCSEVVWRVLATHFIRQFPFHFPSRASPCTMTFQLECTYDLCSASTYDFVSHSSQEIYRNIYTYMRMCVFWYALYIFSKRFAPIWSFTHGVKVKALLVSQQH